VATTLCSLLDAALRSDGAEAPEAADALGAREHYHRQRIHNYVLTHLAEQALSVESIAHAIGLSPRHVHRLYAGRGMPLMRWIWAERLDRCRAELTATDGRQPISAVAYAWGFSDPAHFSRAFRQRFGISPRAVRSIG
jgi:AraC-like DNA-binding protein